MSGLLAVVPQASKKSLGQKPLRDPFDYPSCVEEYFVFCSWSRSPGGGPGEGSTRPFSFGIEGFGPVAGPDPGGLIFVLCFNQPRAQLGYCLVPRCFALICVGFWRPPRGPREARGGPWGTSPGLPRRPRGRGQKRKKNSCSGPSSPGLG